FELELACHDRDDGIDFFILWLAFTATAQAIDLVLNRRTQKPALGYFESSIEEQLFSHLAGQWRNGDAGLQRDLSPHERWVFHGKRQYVAKVSGRHRDV